MPRSREICITIDDLPAANSFGQRGEAIVELNAKIIAGLTARKIPAVGFVNERKLYKTGETDARIRALSLWVENDLELGNHTFNHASLNHVPLEFWLDEVVRGEVVTRSLQDTRNLPMRYFRHPYLNVGRDLQTRRTAETFLSRRGYRIAPVTIDAWDWMFNGVYEDARRRGDTALEERLLAAYLVYTDEVFDYYEKLSAALIGYEPSQIFLLHCNWLLADHFDELFDRVRERGYRFVSLQDALNDAAYSLPDEYVGDRGCSWIDHWAVTRGQPPQHAPRAPSWVAELSGALPHAARERPFFREPRFL
jgi:peptidoglycan/xylan/chitin deacetylase (PgdA/CDA1 family)